MPVGIQLAIALVIGGGLGFFIGWLIGGRKQTIAPTDARLENELRTQVRQREAELTQTREQLSQSKTSLATAQANQAAAEKILAEQKILHEQTLRDAKLTQEKAIADLRDAFKAMSADALKQSAPEFLRLAEQSFGKFQETAKGDLARANGLMGRRLDLRRFLDHTISRGCSFSGVHRLMPPFPVPQHPARDH